MTLAVVGARSAVGLPQVTSSVILTGRRHLLTSPTVSNIDVDARPVGGRGVHFQFGSKAETLERISGGKNFAILPLVRFSYQSWNEERERVAANVVDSLGHAALIVRSSAQGEDGAAESHAGEFDSVLNVTGAELETAVEQVFSSYGSPRTDDEVLIQPMARGLIRSGVAMTCDPLTGSPYFVVNYSDGDDTEAVTAGRAVSSWSLLDAPHVEAPQETRALVDVLRELQKMTGHPHLDVEFGETVGGRIVVFQVRKVTTVSPTSRTVKKARRVSYAARARADQRLRSAQRHAEHADLGPSILGVMPDWNPAELIGLKPRPLAYSLYEAIITSEAWAAGRARLGYKDLRAVPLMHQIGGTPYILVSASLASFVPKRTPRRVMRDLSDAAQGHLLKSPALHDKIEFAVMPTCFKPSLRTSEWRTRFAQIQQVDWDQYLEDLLALTNDVISDPALISSALARHADLERFARQLVTRTSHSESAADALALLRFARVHGTELFSEVARSAFIATDILTDLERSGTIPNGFLDRLVAGAATIGSKIVNDRSTLDVGEFLQQHGHIRPGTYDVTIPRYDAAPQQYFSTRAHESRTDTSPEFTGFAMDGADAYLADQGYSFSWEALLTFARESIRLREEVKHSFTRLLSEAMEILVRYGAAVGLDRDDVSFLTAADIRWVEQVTTRKGQRLTSAARRNRKRWQRDLTVRLPDLISSEDDMFFTRASVAQPTFVTRRRVDAPVASPRDSNLQGTVVFIERADPGFDWLFTHDIAGFVTRFGGENSHMAIRARELDLPAVIGAGDRFDQWSAFHRIVIDAASRTVEAGQ
jgi:phosphohistidine swiveling domain-containing protein